MNVSRLCLGLTLLLLSLAPAFAAEPPPVITGVERQPLTAQVKRLLSALDYLGAPLPDVDRMALDKAMSEADALTSIRTLQQVLDKHVLYVVHINPEMRVKVAAGPAKAELVEQGWRQFLVKVHNEAGTTAPLAGLSPNAESLFQSGSANTPSDRAAKGKPRSFTPQTQDARWLDLQMFDRQPLTPALSGLEVEYRLVQLYSRDAGKREAKVSFNVGQGTQDLGFRNDVDMLFTCLPAYEIKLGVRDENGKPTTAGFEVRDQAGRVYPSQAKRLAPDFAFHPQVYRADGESLKLPAGKYTIIFARGPESIPQTHEVAITDKTKKLDFKASRWIDPSLSGWWSGDHHIHAAGCAHYTNPTEGVHAPDMLRHCLGEDLKVGANLTWGPCFDYQKQFFTGDIDKVSTYPYLLRYDIEVSGFGSHRSGHLCLLRLRDQMYPGGNSSTHWPTLCLNTLRWAKQQGALVGPAHTGWGLQVAGNELPNYNRPRFDGIGANEYIMNVTHQVPGPDGKLVPAVDFLSMVDTPSVWELNIWYHTLNVGYRTRISGETDFPCIYGERVGLGRSYVKLDGKLDYDSWCEAIRVGRNYVSDGYSHLMDFKANNVVMGEKGSELKLTQAGVVKLSAKVAARLNEVPNPELKNRPLDQKPFWQIERARIDGTRQVAVEAIVNGHAVARKNITADGSLQDISFDVKVEKSSWVALRILPSSHTNPIFVLVGDQPIRASRRSAEWCLDGVENCWQQKQRFIAPPEMEQAKADYEHARQAYKRLIQESYPD
ncbi:MAG: hypothetical protein K0Q55_1037 [Verrucomicrobia bacterium]|jgi:hypothetical protein|nr:hypothetical protein [Verrucomicrobiota bacterium]